MTDDLVTVAFVCVQNAGRSQMATAFAERELEERGATDRVRLLTGGTRPADHVHDEVIAVMKEVDIDISGRVPREITFEETASADYVVSMGCSAEDVCPAGWGGDYRDWNLDDPADDSIDGVRQTRDEIRQRVARFFDELLDEDPTTN